MILFGLDYFFLLNIFKGRENICRRTSNYILSRGEKNSLFTICHKYRCLCGLPGGDSGKEPACQCRSLKRHRFDPWIRKIPWRKAWQSTPVFLPREPMDRGIWQVAILRVTQSQTQLKQLSTHACRYLCTML